MTVEQWIAVAGIVLGSGAFCKIIDSICVAINNRRKRKSNKKDRIDNLTDEVAELTGLVKNIQAEMSVSALQDAKVELMMLMRDYPNLDGDIFDRAKHYFMELKGDSYISDLFDNWLTIRGHSRPEWFIKILKEENKIK